MKHRYALQKNIEVKWYGISNKDWMIFIDFLRRYGRTNPKEQVYDMSDSERYMWDCYYIAKSHGRNKNGCFELPWVRREKVLEAIMEEKL